MTYKPDQKVIEEFEKIFSAKIVGVGAGVWFQVMSGALKSFILALRKEDREAVRKEDAKIIRDNADRLKSALTALDIPKSKGLIEQLLSKLYELADVISPN